MNAHSTLDPAGWPRRGEDGPAVVALGGGHGLSATLRALRHVTHRLTAVVTVADDGGSSGRLRREFDCLPPGDLRMALAALTDDSEWGLTWRDVLQHRFAGQGELDNHALGNLLILALWQLLGDEVEGPRVPHGIVPDGYFCGEGLGAEGVPPFVEPVCVGLFSVADEVFAAGFNVVGFAHGA